jgi:hypothetical protein
MIGRSRLAVNQFYTGVAHAPVLKTLTYFLRHSHIKVGCPILLPCCWGEDGPAVPIVARDVPWLRPACPILSPKEGDESLSRAKPREWGTRIFGGERPEDERMGQPPLGTSIQAHVPSAPDEVAGRRLRRRGHVPRFRAGLVAWRRRAAGLPANRARAARQTARQVRRDGP